MFFMISHYQPRSWVTVLWHFVLLFVVALACHGELAIGRPSPRHLTEFYLLISVGGVLGGLVNALIAPLVFNSLLEYPLAMALACVLVAGTRARPAGARARLLSVALPLGVILLALVLYSESLTLQVDTAFLIRVFDPGSHLITTWINPAERLVNKVLTYGVPLLACVAAVAAAARPRRGPGGRARRGGLRRRAEQRGDPAGAELLRRASRHARPRHQGLHGAAPRHDAARPAGQ